MNGSSFVGLLGFQDIKAVEGSIIAKNHTVYVCPLDHWQSYECNGYSD